MRYPVLLFDADNTLFNFDQAEQFAFKETMLELHGSYCEDWLGHYIQINSQMWKAFEQGKVEQADLKRLRFQRFLEQVEIPLDPVETNREYLHRLSQCTFLIPGASEIVKAVGKDRTLLLVTNGLKDVQRPRFAKSAITQHFDGIVISDELGIAKPKPEIFQHAFELAGNPEKHDVLMIGDSLSSDMTGGKHFGIDTCWFNPKGLTNDRDLSITYEIQRLEQLADIV